MRIFFSRKSFFFLSAFLLTTVVCNAQVSVTPGGVNYTTLKGAFDAINAGTHTGAINISIVGNTTETASAVLNASGIGSANYSSIVVSPSGGAARSITGAIAGQLIDLNGASNVTIDGLNSGGNSLIINNTNTGLCTTIRFIGDASNNIIRNTTILGASSDITSSTVFFSTGTTTGNDNNTITGCVFGGSGANLAATAISSLGTNTIGIENSGNTISNCAIADFFNAAIVSNGIYLQTGSTEWTITNNKFYQTAVRTYTNANTHFAIRINTSGNNFTVTDNTIGFNNATGTGTYTMNSTVGTRFIGINITTAVGTASNVQGNTISGISLNTSSGASTLNGVLCGINITAGIVNVGTTAANIIGATAGVNLLTVVSTTIGAAVVGIHSSSTNTIAIQNNTIGGLSSSGTTATISGNILGINISNVGSAITISGNTIGNTTADNLRGGTLGLTTGSSNVVGINFITNSIVTANVQNNVIQNMASYGTGTGGNVRGIQTSQLAANLSLYNISSNVIRNLTTNASNTTVGSGLTCVAGIIIAIGTNNILSQNVIHSLSNINTTAIGTHVVGISIANATNVTVRKSVIYNLSNAGTSVSATAPSVVAGIFIRSGTTANTIVNNMISLGNGQTTNTAFVGILGNHGSAPDPLSRIYYNTINITGSVATGAQPSFCYGRTDFSTTARLAPVDIRNNIFNNTRTGGSGNHYAIANNFGAIAASNVGWGTNAANYNVLNANASTIGFWNAPLNFANWKVASVSDDASLTAVPLTFVNAAIADLHVSNSATLPIESAGTPIAGITDDFDGDLRNTTLPDIGSDENNFSVLPLQWLSVQGALNTNKQASITFKVNENKVAYFTIEKSTNGRNFTSFTSLNSKGNGENSYVVTDFTSLNGVSYYRVKQTDIDGQYSYSAIVKLSANANSSMSVFPNPLSITAKISGATVGSTIQLVDVNGKLLQNIKITNPTFTVDMSGYSKGLYLLQSNNQVITIIKE